MTAPRGALELRLVPASGKPDHFDLPTKGKRRLKLALLPSPGDSVGMEFQAGPIPSAIQSAPNGESKAGFDVTPNPGSEPRQRKRSYAKPELKQPESTALIQFLRPSALAGDPAAQFGRSVVSPSGASGRKGTVLAAPR
jgi:hypothetical protein